MCSSAESERNLKVFNANSNSISDSNLKCTENQLNKRVLAANGKDGSARKHKEKCWSVAGGEVSHFIKHQLNVRFPRQKHAYLN